MEELMLIEYLKEKEKQVIPKVDELKAESKKLLDSTQKSSIIQPLHVAMDKNQMDHFNEPYVKYLVSNMYHFENGKKYLGEWFNMDKAKETCERYRGIISASITAADMYLALNLQYHDYGALFKAWFGEDMELKIIESAIRFWFKDEDYKSGFKLWNYFKGL